MQVGRTHLNRFSAGAALFWKVGLLTVPVAVVIFTVFVVAAARSNSVALDDDAAAALGDRAAHVVDGYIAHLVDDTHALASMPELRALATTGQRQLQSEDLEKLDEAWTQRRKVPAPMPVESVIKEMLASPMSRYFTQIVNNKAGVMREILLTDRAGRLVAASGPTEDFEQQDEDWWKSAIRLSDSCASAKDCAYVGDVEFDASVGGHGFDLAVPVFDNHRTATGVLKIVFDPRDIAPLLTLAAGNHPIRVALIRRDGTDVLGNGSPFLRDDRSDSGVPSAVPDQLRNLPADQQATVTVGDESSPVRALAGRSSNRWAVVVLRSVRPIRGWVQMSAVAIVIVVMFLLSVRAYALLFSRTRSDV